MEQIIEFKNVSREYGEKENRFYAVKDVSFSINRGEVVVILGQSGAGKSTVLNMLGGIDQPTSGSVIINGKDITHYNEKQMEAYRANEIGFIFQFYNLLTGLTAYENVSLAKEIVNNSLDADEMLEAVGLIEKKKKFPAQMSGGEQQRISIARALAKNPEVILADEPTGALDSDTGKQVLQVIYNVAKENKKTLIIVTHNATIADCADKVIYMKNSQIQKIENNDKPTRVEELQL